MKASVSSYSYQRLISKGEMSQLDVVRVASEMGFEGIDFTELKTNPTSKEPCPLEEQLRYAEQIRQEAERYGIAVVAYTVGANLYQGSAEADEKEVLRLMGQVDVAAALGAKVMRHDVCSSHRVGSTVVGYDRMLPTIAKNAARIAEYAQTKGVRTCSENHGYVAQDSDRVERLYYAVNHENYGLLVDVGNFACADEDSVRAVSRLAPYAIHVHVKDFHKIPYGTPIDPEKKSFSTRGCNRLMGCAVGEGDIPVEQCLAILKRAEYDGFLTIEYEGNGDCLDEIRRGLANLRTYIAAVGG